MNTRRSFLKSLGAVLVGAVVAPSVVVSQWATPVRAALPAAKSDIDIRVVSMPVKAPFRKLRCTWTPEIAADLKTQYGIDTIAEQELVMAMQHHL